MYLAAIEKNMARDAKANKRNKEKGQPQTN